MPGTYQAVSKPKSGPWGSGSSEAGGENKAELAQAESDTPSLPKGEPCLDGHVKSAHRGPGALSCHFSDQCEPPPGL